VKNPIRVAAGTGQSKVSTKKSKRKLSYVAGVTGLAAGSRVEMGKMHLCFQGKHRNTLAWKRAWPTNTGRARCFDEADKALGFSISQKLCLQARKRA